MSIAQWPSSCKTVICPGPNRKILTGTKPSIKGPALAIPAYMKLVSCNYFDRVHAKGC